MAKPVVLVTRKLPEGVQDRLAAMFDARLNPADETWYRDGAEIVRRATETGAAGILCAAGDALNAQTIAALPPMAAIIAFCPVNMFLKSPGSGANRSLNAGIVSRGSGLGVSHGWPPGGSWGPTASTPATGGDARSVGAGASWAEALPSRRHRTSAAT